MRVYKFCIYILKNLEESPTVNSMSNVRGRKVLNETPHVLEGSGLAPVDGMGREIRGMRTRG
jgi:hypothetical protein